MISSGCSFFGGDDGGSGGGDSGGQYVSMCECVSDRSLNADNFHAKVLQALQ